MATGMGGAGRRRKGNSNELKISKQLTKWANGKAVFTRSPNSGAWGSTHGVHSTISGDIATEAEEWPISFELKNHEAFTSMDKIYHSSTLITDFWQQNIGDAKRTHKVPLLLLHRNRSAQYAVVPYSSNLHNAFRVAGKDYGIFNLRWRDERLEQDNTQEVISFVLDDFLELFEYDQVVAMSPVWFQDWYASLEVNND